jgi:hypothetical protein
VKPAMELHKSAPLFAVTGETITYTITYLNNGTSIRRLDK